jgi:hypothetical protein
MNSSLRLKTILFHQSFIYNTRPNHSRNEHQSGWLGAGGGVMGMVNEVRQYYTSRMSMRKLDAEGLYQKLRYFYLYFRDRDYFKEKLGIRSDILPERAKNKAAMALKFQIFPLETWLTEDIVEEKLFDAIEFLYDHVSQPGELYDILTCCCGVCQDYDGYDTEAGREEFRQEINGILVDYNDGYILGETGQIVSVTKEVRK